MITNLSSVGLGTQSKGCLACAVALSSQPQFITKTSLQYKMLLKASYMPSTLLQLSISNPRISFRRYYSIYRITVKNAMYC